MLNVVNALSDGNEGRERHPETEGCATGVHHLCAVDDCVDVPFFFLSCRDEC